MGHNMKNPLILEGGPPLQKFHVSLIPPPTTNKLLINKELLVRAVQQQHRYQTYNGSNITTRRMTVTVAAPRVARILTT